MKNKEKGSKDIFYLIVSSLDERLSLPVNSSRFQVNIKTTEGKMRIELYNFIKNVLLLTGEHQMEYLRVFTNYLLTCLLIEGNQTLTL